MAATPFFREGEGRVLVVDPVYKSMWHTCRAARPRRTTPCTPSADARWPTNWAWTVRRVGCWRWTGRRAAPSARTTPSSLKRMVTVYDGRVLSFEEIREI